MLKRTWLSAATLVLTLQAGLAAESSHQGIQLRVHFLSTPQGIVGRAGAVNFRSTNVAFLYTEAERALFAWSSPEQPRRSPKPKA